MYHLPAIYSYLLRDTQTPMINVGPY